MEVDVITGEITIIEFEAPPVIVDTTIENSINHEPPTNQDTPTG